MRENNHIDCEKHGNTPALLDNAIDCALSSRLITNKKFDYTEFFHQGIGETKTRRFNVLHVPGRDSKRKTDPLVDLMQPFNESSFNFNAEKVEQNKEILFEKVFKGVPVSFIQQVFPFLHKHFLMTPERKLNRTQALEYQDIHLALFLIHQNPMQLLRFGFNSLASGASVNHLHLQGFYLKAAAELLPIENESTNTLFQHNDITVSELSEYPANGWKLSTQNNMAGLAALSDKYISHLQRNNIAHVVVFAPNTIFILPVNKNHMTAFGNTWTFAELMGYILIIKPQHVLAHTFNRTDIRTYEELNVVRNNSCPSRILEVIEGDEIEHKIEKEMKQVSVHNWEVVKQSIQDDVDALKTKCDASENTIALCESIFGMKSTVVKSEVVIANEPKWQPGFFNQFYHWITGNQLQRVDNHNVETGRYLV